MPSLNFGLPSRSPAFLSVLHVQRDWPASGDRFPAQYDSGGECGRAYYRHTLMPTPAEDRPWFSFDFGPIHFIQYSTGKQGPAWLHCLSCCFVSSFSSSHTLPRGARGGLLSGRLGCPDPPPAPARALKHACIVRRRAAMPALAPSAPGCCPPPHPHPTHHTPTAHTHTYTHTTIPAHTYTTSHPPSTTTPTPDPTCPAACICYARAVGTPIYSFQAGPCEGGQQGGSWALSHRAPDPLQALGGLPAVSEGGRLAAGVAAPAEDDGSDIERQALWGACVVPAVPAQGTGPGPARPASCSSGAAFMRGPLQ